MCSPVPVNFQYPRDLLKTRRHRTIESPEIGAGTHRFQQLPDNRAFSLFFGGLPHPHRFRSTFNISKKPAGQLITFNSSLSKSDLAVPADCPGAVCASERRTGGEPVCIRVPALLKYSPRLRSESVWGCNCSYTLKGLAFYRVWSPTLRSSQKEATQV